MVCKENNFDLPLLQSAPRWIIAYSGGLDSHVLLHLSHQAATLQSKKMLVVHVHHGLSPFADDWLAHCDKITHALNLPFESIKVKVDPQKGESLEACARAARYAALEKFVEEDDVLLTAHHLDDQAETFLLQLLRGAGVKGLSGMPQVKAFSKGSLVRPLLFTPHQKILDYANENHLVWIVDESNANTNFDRNFLRHEIIPKLKSRWPALATVLNRSAKQLVESDELLMELGRGDYRRCEEQSDAATQTTPSASPPPLPRGEFKNLDCFAPLAMTGIHTRILDRLSITHLKTLSPARLHNALRTWLYDFKIPLPSAAILSRIDPELLSSRNDKQGLVSWDRYELRSFEGKLYLSHCLEPFDTKQRFTWDLSEDLVLPIGTLTSALKTALQLPAEVRQVEVRFRQGGERFHPRNRAHSQTLKKLFQEWHIPTWLRDRVPLFYVEDKLVGVLSYSTKIILP